MVKSEHLTREFHSFDFVYSPIVGVFRYHSPMATPPPILGEDPSFLEVEEQISRLAAIDRPCLVIGERGTGKELLATRLHYLSPRWDGPFVKINCAALAESLLDTELFGHEAGAFTGAQRQHIGRFERADGGTLLLDEISSASTAVQEKVLRVIEYGEMERVGGRRTIQLDVRVIGAANVDLPSLARSGTFRADLARSARLRGGHDPTASRPAGRHHDARRCVRPGDHSRPGQGRISRIRPAGRGIVARTLLAGKRAGAEERRRARRLSLRVIGCARRHRGHRPLREQVAAVSRPDRNGHRAAGPRSAIGRARTRGTCPAPGASGRLPGRGGAVRTSACSSGRSMHPGTARPAPHALLGSGTTSSEDC